MNEGNVKQVVVNGEVTNQDIARAISELNVSELEQLKSDDIIFSNAEFYDYLLKKLKVDVLTRADLNSISFLKIDDQFSNCDFSDFKYLPNLSKVLYLIKFILSEIEPTLKLFLNVKTVSSG